MTSRVLTAPAPVKTLWARPAAAVAVVAGGGIVSGGVWAFAMPRGPVDAGSGLALMVTGLLLGVLAGMVLRRRRAVWVVLLAHVAAYELVRLPVDGPSVDGIHLDSTYGVIGFVTGRLFDGVLLGLPALVGVLYGAGLARGWDGSARGPAVVRRVLAGALAVAVLGFAVLVAQPASTAPIPGPHSVAELATLRIGGHEQTVMLRGRSVQAPVLLYLAGGPGGTDLGAMRLFGEQLESDFVVATWDQRGTGSSFGALDPTSTLTLEQAVADTIELAQTLKDRFGQDRIYLVGNSWGTLLGVLAAQQRPDLFAAYVGTGQMVSPVETDRMFYADTLDWARSHGDDALTAALLDNGPPPYDDFYPYESALRHGHAWHDDPAFDPSGEMPSNLFVEEYDLVQKVRALPATADTFAVLYPQVQGIDLRTQAAQLQVPVYVVSGEFEARGRIGLAREWFDVLVAPDKRWIELPRSGHRPHFEQPDAFAAVMRTVLSETR
ncbi:alpha/beta fold hydrolase [Pseudonocardia saturnea]